MPSKFQLPSVLRLGDTGRRVICLPVVSNVTKAKLVKSVQPILSHPEKLQSPRNYASFLSKSHLHGMIL